MSRKSIEVLIKDWAQTNLEYKKDTFIVSKDLYAFFLTTSNFDTKSISIKKFSAHVLQVWSPQVKKARKAVNGKMVWGFLHIQSIRDDDLNKRVYQLGKSRLTRIKVEEFFSLVSSKDDSVFLDKLLQSGSKTPTVVGELLPDRIVLTFEEFVRDVESKIIRSTERVIRGIHNELLTLYYSLGKQFTIHGEFYGENFFENLSKELRKIFPDKKGFSMTNLRSMLLFAATINTAEFPIFLDLPWGHTRFLLEKFQEKERIIFYAKNSKQYGWSRNVLIFWTNTDLYAREGGIVSNYSSTLSNEQSNLLIKSIKDPIIMDYIPITRLLKERDLQRGIVDNIEKFIQEIGGDLVFCGKEVPLSFGNKTYYLDLLFYHISFRCYFVIELKIGDYKPAYISQLSNYVDLVNQYVKKQDDNPSVGLLLCGSSDGKEVKRNIDNQKQPLGMTHYTLIDRIQKKFEEEIRALEDTLDPKKKDDESNESDY